MFKHGYEPDLINRPVKYGGQFKKPTLKEKRRSRKEHDRMNGKRLFDPDQMRLLLEEAQGQMRAMILLGINGGFGNTDCAELPIGAVDLDDAVIEYERPKTAIQRVVPLWPEAATALQEVLRDRSKPRNPEHNQLVFLTAFGNPWKRDVVRIGGEAAPTVARQQAVSAEFSKLLVRLGLKRPGLSFYALRQTFRTWADETKDQHAVHRIMGHAIPGMSDVYVDEIELDRLRAVVDHVRSKVFPSR
jgi:integrase